METPGHNRAMVEPDPKLILKGNDCTTLSDSREIFREPVGALLNVTILLQKLIEIEQSIGTHSDSEILDKIFDREDCLLRMQSEMIESLRHHPRRQVIQKIGGSSLAA